MYTYMYNRRIQAYYIIRYKVHSLKLYSVRIFTHTYITKKIDKKERHLSNQSRYIYNISKFFLNESNAQYTCFLI